jgi:release factor glutamine methyltransferase
MPCPDDANVMMSMHSTVTELLKEAEQRLQHLDSARLDVEVLLAFVLNTGREALYAHPEKTVQPDLAADFQSLIAKRSDCFPIAYLTGHREFWSVDLLVSQDTLIPRPETESLVEAALELIPEDASMNVLDIGTGSGAIAIAIARERPQCHVTASDISRDALAVAQKNAVRFDIRNIGFKVSDWFSAFTGEVFDMVVCNPPYVDSQDSAFQNGEIRYEPRIALDGGYLGMQMINHIIPATRDHLKQNAPLILEHGYDQGESIRYQFISSNYVDVKSRFDYAGRERISMARKAK